MKFRTDDPDLKAAVWKIARTPEGTVLFAALQSVVEEIGPTDTCALHAHNERRKFAANLIAMAEAERINERTDDTRGNAGTSGNPAATEAPKVSAEAQPPVTEKPVRPDYIPESFWDADKGFKSEDFDALVAFKSEQDSRSASVPENKDGYKVGLPVDFKIEGLEIPAGESPIDENDPRIGFARDYAHANGYTQSQFEGLIAFGVQLDHAENQQIQEALGEQAKALGGKAKERVLAINSWLGARLGGEVAAALAPMMMTAKQVEAFERIMSLNRTVPGNPGAGRDGNGDPTKIDGYETMTFRQRLAAIDAQKSAR